MVENRTIVTRRNKYKEASARKLSVTHPQVFSIWYNLLKSGQLHSFAFEGLQHLL